MHVSFHFENYPFCSAPFPTATQKVTPHTHNTHTHTRHVKKSIAAAFDRRGRGTSRRETETGQDNLPRAAGHHAGMPGAFSITRLILSRGSHGPATIAGCSVSLWQSNATRGRSDAPRISAEPADALCNWCSRPRWVFLGCAVYRRCT